MGVVVLYTIPKDHGLWFKRLRAGDTKFKTEILIDTNKRRRYPFTNLKHDIDVRRLTVLSTLTEREEQSERECQLESYSHNMTAFSFLQE